MKVLLMVIDSFGIGEMPDAKNYGDEGSNTFLNMNNKMPLVIPNLEKLGFKKIDGINLPTEENIVGNYGRLKELSVGKDTTTGHLEMSGVIIDQPFPTYPNGFSKKVINKIEETIGLEVLGGQAISGTKVIELLGEKHIKTKKPIVYTSADSVIQIATHIDVYTIEELYEMCKKLRDVTEGEFGFGRIIARPFDGKDAKSFFRLPYRKDFALDPPGTTMLSILKQNNFDVIGVGKINDVFNGVGITDSIPAKNNQQSIEGIKKAIKQNPNGLIFANLVDTDMLFGHRNDVKGYKEAVEKIDKELPSIINSLNDEDVFIITADHGCDPTTVSTDHSREYVPLLIYGKNLKQSVNLGTLDGFNNISNLILELFNLKEDSILKNIKA